MSTDQQLTGETYVYGITAAGAELPAGLTGVGGAPVAHEDLGDVAVLYSQIPDIQGFGTPADIRAHAGVLDTLATHMPVLPMTFATIVPGLDTLEEIHDETRQREYMGALEKVRGALQFTVRARYVEETALGELVTEHPEISRLREATRGQAPEATYYERIRLGELVVGGMQRKAAAEAPAIVEALRPLTRDLRLRETGQAEEILDAAALVPAETRQDFEDVLEDLGRSMAERVIFRLVGPQAPYDFVTEE